jgi:hypothetical protein
MSDLDQQLRQLFKEKEAVVGRPPVTTLPEMNTVIGEQASSGNASRLRPLLQVFALVAVVALVVVGVNVLKDGVHPDLASTTAQTWADSLGDISPLRMPKSLRPLPVHTNLPASVPSPDDDLPSLLNDLPGRVQMVWYPAPASGCDVQGWARETIDFYGVDGTWRRLNMADLRLPESSWPPGCISAGPGSLSPNGRWWTIGAKGMFVLLDLRTGHLATKQSNAGWGGGWSQNSQQVLTVGNRAGSLWKVPGIYLTGTPGTKDVGLSTLPLPEGGYVIDEDTLSSNPDGGSMTLRYYAPTGNLSRTREVPTPPSRDCSLEALVGDRVGMVCIGKPNKEPHVFYVLDESSWRVVAALEIPEDANAYPAEFLNPDMWVLDTGDGVGLWQIDEDQVGTVLHLPDEAKSAKWYSFNQYGFAGDLVRD